MTGHNSSLKQFIEHKKGLERRWGASIRSLPDYLIRNFGIGKPLILSTITVGFFLLLACANVAGLLLTRAARLGSSCAVR